MRISNRITKLIAFFRKYDVVKTLYWRCKLKLPRCSSFHIFPKSIIDIARDARITIERGEFTVNESWFSNRKRRYVSEFRLDKDSRLLCKGDFRLFQGASIYVAPQAELILHGGGSFLNTNSTLNCFHHIEIGKGCAISDNVCIADSDSHYINGEKDAMMSPIIIGDHVWIGKNVTVLKGVHIGDGAIVGAGSVVVKDIPAGCLAVGNPARVIKENVEWK